MNEGGPGAVGENWIERSDGRVEKLGHLAQAEMRCDDVFVVCTPGGGGCGRHEK
jgi:5-oxoprolinase (ATP-hydrolysing)